MHKALTKKCLVFSIGDLLWEKAVYKRWFLRPPEVKIP